MRGCFPGEPGDFLIPSLIAYIPDVDALDAAGKFRDDASVEFRIALAAVAYGDRG